MDNYVTWSDFIQLMSSIAVWGTFMVALAEFIHNNKKK